MLPQRPRLRGRGSAQLRLLRCHWELSASQEALRGRGVGEATAGVGSPPATGQATRCRGTKRHAQVCAVLCCAALCSRGWRLQHFNSLTPTTRKHADCLT